VIHADPVSIGALGGDARCATDRKSALRLGWSRTLARRLFRNNSWARSIVFTARPDHLVTEEGVKSDRDIDAKLVQFLVAKLPASVVSTK
jgi:hypothetical protein